MGGMVKIRHSPQPVGVNAAQGFTGDEIGGFLAITAGTVTITKRDGTVLINAVPVSAGQWLPMPFYIGPNGGTCTTAGGASGVLGN